MIPTFIFQTWLLGLFSVGLIAGSVYFGHEWQQRSWRWDSLHQQSIFTPDWGLNETTALFAGAMFLALLVVAGGPLLKLLLFLLKGGKNREAGQDPRRAVPPVSVQKLRRPDGSELHVEFHGPESGQPIILTHGWGLDSSEFNYFKQDLGNHYRIITWDEPGLGKSTRPANRDYSLENLARNLEAVLSLTDRPAVLLGHSIGGMIILTFWRLFGSALAGRVGGLVLTHTTFTDPVKTTSGAGFYTIIEKPVLMPLMYLTILFSPLLRLMNWLSYFNGSAHLSALRSSFAGQETWAQIDHVARLQAKASPAVLARGMLGMMHYDAMAVLPLITAPTLIVAGDKDSTTKPDASRFMSDHIPGAGLVMLSPAKHLGLLEHHEHYAQVVGAFVRSTAKS